MGRLPRSPRRSGRPHLLMIGAVLLVGIAAVALAFTASRPAATAGAPPPAPAAVPHFIDVNAPGAPRVLVIGAANETLPGTSSPAGMLMSNLQAGNIPSGATSATVLSDSNCAPDADGISHCLNELKVGGTVVTVQHHHAMAEVPCLSPGETVTLMSLTQYRSQS